MSCTIFLAAMSLVFASKAVSQVTINNPKESTIGIDSLLKAAWASGRTNPAKSIRLLKTIDSLNAGRSKPHKPDVVYYYYAVFYKNMNRFEESEALFDKYENFQEQAGNRPQLVASANMAKANLYSDWGRYAKGMQAATRAITLYDQAKDTLGMVRSGYKLGFFLLETGNASEAKKHFLKSIGLSKQQGNLLEEGIGYQNLGMAYEKEKNLDSAYRAYYRGYILGEQIADAYNKIINRYNMANILHAQKKYPEAMQYAKEGLRLADSLQIPTLRAASTQMVAQLQIAMGQYNEGLHSLEKMAVGEGKMLGLKDKMEMYGLLVAGYKAQGNMPKAFENLEIFKTLNDSLLSTETRKRINELEIQYETEKRKQQIALLTTENNLSALELKRQAERNEALQTENLLKAEKLAQQELLNLALQREKILADSNLTKQELINAAMVRENLLQKRELDQQQQIANLLRSENILKESNLMSSRRSQRQLGGGVIALGLLGSIIFWLYRQQKEKNTIIARQSEHLEILNKEIHHRVKNNLQVVSSMLDLQAETIPDKATAAMFQEGSKRVQTMAFIHQNLYQGDSANSVNMTEYIQMLVEHLFDSYNINPDAIQLETHIQPLRLHTDTVIPIGMILNELISNALKYAFRESGTGTVTVRLHENDNKLLLQVKDNGKGMDKLPEIEKSNSFGYKIIRAFSKKLKAQLVMDNTAGSDITLLIGKYKMM